MEDHTTRCLFIRTIEIKGCAVSLGGYPVFMSEEVYEPRCRVELDRPAFDPAGQEELLLRVPLDWIFIQGLFPNIVLMLSVAA